MVADSLNKGDLSTAMHYVERSTQELGYMSRILMKWLNNPTLSRVFCMAIMLERYYDGFPGLVDSIVTEEILALVIYLGKMLITIASLHFSQDWPLMVL